MGDSLQKRIDTFVRQVFAAGPGAWLVWCDPRREWLPLLERVAGDGRLGGFALLAIDETTAGTFGGPVARKQLQTQLATGESFLLHVPVAQDELGWLWAQALLAELIYDRSLRGQLQEWEWRPASLTIGDDEVAALARNNLQRDPAEWSGGGLQPDPERLLQILAGFGEPDADNRLLVDLSVEAAGLPLLASTDLPGWRGRALARLLVTQAHQVAPARIPAEHELLIAPAQRDVALRLLARWADSHHLAQALPDAIVQADRIAQLGTLLGGAAVTEAPFVSQAAEQAIFAATCSRLAEQSGRALLEALAALGPALERHAQGLWGRRLAGHAQAVPWSELQRLSHAAQELLAASPASTWPTVQAALAWYVAGGWRMDRAGEQINRNLAVSTPDLVRLIAPLRAAFRARWEESLMRWSELWSNAGCPLPAGLPTAGSWLKSQLSNQRPTAILVLDALRFELGATIAEWIDRQEGVARTVVQPARAPLPSITALGMGMALPIEEARLRADLVDGKWQLTEEGRTANLSIAEKRRSWWNTDVAQVEIKSLEEIIDVQFSAPGGNCKRLVVYDATVDTMGHDDQLAFQGSEPALKRYIAAIERLRNLGWRRILVVTDHGYIHWPANEEKNTEPPVAGPAYASRRALAYPLSVTLPQPWAFAPGQQWRVALPRGAASFRAYGGLGYFHGGASLQEWIIPCIAIEWPQHARPVTVTLDAIDRVMSQRPKVTVSVVADSLLREESIARQVQVIIRNQQTQVVLFRSDAVLASVEAPQLALTLDAVPGAVAPRSTLLSVEVRDPGTEEALDTKTATLMIELTGW